MSKRNKRHAYEYNRAYVAAHRDAINQRQRQRRALRRVRKPPLVTTWSDRKLARRLERLHREQYSYNEIAVQLSQEFSLEISRNAVAGRIRRLARRARQSNMECETRTPAAQREAGGP